MSEIQIDGQTVVFEVMSGEDMYWRFYGSEAGQKSNPDLFDRIKYLGSNEMFRERHIVAYLFGTERVVGDAALQISPYDPNEMWSKHVSVDEDYQRKGIARKLLEERFKFMATTGMHLQLSTYSEEGLRYLKPMLAEMTKEFPAIKIYEAKR